MGLIENIKVKAKLQLRTIVLPESEDERVLKATQQVLEEKTAKVVLIGNAETIKADAIKCGAKIADEQYFKTSKTMIDPAGHPFCIGTYIHEPG